MPQGRLTPEFGIPLSDHGARMYARTFWRWTTAAPLSEKYYGISPPYAYCANDPVNAVDPDGKKRKCVIDYKENEIRITSTFVYYESQLRDGIQYAIWMLNTGR